MVVNMDSKRLDYLDRAKGIGIILVIIGHMPGIPGWLNHYIAAFHMPLFFVISGILLRLTGEENRPYKTIFIRKCRTILVPYFSFSLLYLLISCITVWIKPQNMTWVDVQRDAIHALTFSGLSVLWFLSALFFAELIFLALRRKTNLKISAIAAILLVLSAYGGNLLMDAYYPMFRSMPVLWVGYFIKSLLRGIFCIGFLASGYYAFPIITAISNKKALFTALLFFAVNIVAERLNEGVDLHFMMFHNLFYYFAAAFSGSFAVLLFSRLLSLFLFLKPVCRLLQYWGKNSLIIMVSHLDFRVLIMSIHFAFFMNQYITRAKDYFLYANIALAVIALETIWIEGINRITPFLLGKGFKKRKV